MNVAGAMSFKLSTLLMCAVLFPANALTRQLAAENRKPAVESFLKAWLVKKDLTSALIFFYAKALADGFVLACSCCGESSVSESERQDAEVVERKLRLFLKDFSGVPKSRNLNEILFLKSSDNPEHSAELATKLGKRVLNQPGRDKYYLVDYSVLEPVVELAEHFKRRYDLRGAFYSVIQYRILNEDVRHGDDVMVHLLWVWDKGK